MRSRTALTGFAIRGITALLPRQYHFIYTEDSVSLKKKRSHRFPFLKFGAGKESRTLDLNLGKVALYQLSYSRISSLKL